MKKHLHLIAITWLATFSINLCSAQLIGSRAFLKGNWLEAGMQLNGSLGTTSPPSGYHPHPGSGLGAVYDIDHDGWTAGTPMYMGDYFLGGSSFEGWELQAESERNQAFQATGVGYIISGPSMFSTGSITTVTDTGGKYIAWWYGTSLAGKLNLSMQTIIDSAASWILMKVKITNVSSATVPDIFYFRGCDPNNDHSWPGGSTTTDNWVTYQDDALHRVLVSARSTANPKAFIGLGTIDSRAKAFHFAGLPISITTDLGSMYAETFPATYTPAFHDTADEGIGLIFNIGSLAAGDSTEISYSYIFSDTTAIDSAISVPTTLATSDIHSQQSVAIWPNPATSELFINTSDAVSKELSIFNCLGQPVIHQIFSGHSTKINVQHLPAGMYYVAVRNGHETMMQRFVKEQ